MLKQLSAQLPWEDEPKMKSAVKKPGSSPTRRGDCPNGTQAVRFAAVTVITILALCAGLSAVKFRSSRTTRYLARDDRRRCRPRFTRRPHRATARRHQQDRRRTRLTAPTCISFGVAPALVLYVTLLDGKPACARS